MAQTAINYNDTHNVIGTNPKNVFSRSTDNQPVRDFRSDSSVILAISKFLDIEELAKLGSLSFNMYQQVVNIMSAKRASLTLKVFATKERYGAININRASTISGRFLRTYPRITLYCDESIPMHEMLMGILLKMPHVEEITLFDYVSGIFDILDFQQFPKLICCKLISSNVMRLGLPRGLDTLQVIGSTTIGTVDAPELRCLHICNVMPGSPSIFWSSGEDRVYAGWSNVSIHPQLNHAKEVLLDNIHLGRSLDFSKMFMIEKLLLRRVFVNCILPKNVNILELDGPYAKESVGSIDKNLDIRKFEALSVFMKKCRVFTNRVLRVSTSDMVFLNYDKDSGSISL